MQEASGKTHTLQGTADSPGVVPRALDLLLGSAAAHPLRDSAAVQLSMLELHNDAVHDLLAQECAHAGGAQAELPKLELRSDSHGAVAVGTHACVFVCVLHWPTTHGGAVEARQRCCQGPYVYRVVTLHAYICVYT